MHPFICRYAGIITATKAIRSASGEVVEVQADFEPLKEGTKPPKVPVMPLAQLGRTTTLP